MDDTQKRQFQDIERPDVALNGIASDTWQAFNAMETTKRRHYSLLEILDNKKKNYNLEPSVREQQLLAALLKDHDEQVKRFTLASKTLKQLDAAAHLQLFRYISGVSELENYAPIAH